MILDNRSSILDVQYQVSRIKNPASKIKYQDETEFQRHKHKSSGGAERSG